MIIEKTLVVGPFQCNCRLLVCPKSGLAVLVDPGDEAPRILAEIENSTLPNGQRVRVQYLFHTHAHLDHIGGTRGVKEGLYKSGETETPKIGLHKADAPLYAGLKMQGGLFGLSYDDPLPIDHYFQDEESLQVGEMKFSIIHTPGHSPGSVCIRLHEDTRFQIPEVIFSGDTLFQGSVGRTDLWGGDSETLFKSIRRRILTLDDDIRISPGHGDDTRVGIEKRQNPFLI